MDSKRICFLVAVVVLSLAPAGQAQFSWHSVGGVTPPGATPQITLISFDTMTMTATIQVDIQGFWESVVTEGPNTYRVVRLPHDPVTDSTSAAQYCGMYHGPGQYGYSDVPVVRVSLGIPSDATEVIVTNIAVAGPEALGPVPITGRIYPDIGQVQPGTPAAFYADPAHYASTQPFPFDPLSPPYAELRYPVRDWHNVRVATIPICPLFTVPATQTGVVYSMTTYSISFSGTAVWPAHISPVWDRILDGHLINRPVFPPPSPRQEQLLIFVPDGYASNTALLAFETWKKREGFNVTVKGMPSDVWINSASVAKAVSDFAGANTCNDIYVLFIGDKADVPMSTFTMKNPNGSVAGNYDSDYDYACLGDANDLYADVMYGRISIDDAADLTNIMYKIMAYEKAPPDGDWVKNVVMAAHREWRYNPVTKANGYEFAYWKDIMSGTAYSIVTPNFRKRYGHQGATKAQVLDDINSWHCGIVNYDGHGGNWPSVWWQWDGASASLGEADVTGLTNGSYTPLVIAICCWNGNVLQADAIGEEWIESASKGAVGHIGFCIPEWITAGSQFDLKFLKKVFDKGIYRVGAALVAAHNENVKEYVDAVKNNVWNKNYGMDDAFGCILFGDPTMMIRTAATRYFDDPVKISENPINPGNQSVTVTVEEGGIGVAGARVCLEKTGDVFALGVTNASGEVTFNINPASSGWLYATVSKHNYTVWEGNPKQPPDVGDWRRY